MVDEGRYLASRIPGARFIELPGNDHLPFVGDQDAIVSEIERFVASFGSVAGEERALGTVLCVCERTAGAVDSARVESLTRPIVSRYRGQ